MHVSRRLAVFLVFVVVGPALGWLTLFSIDAVMWFFLPKTFVGAFWRLRGGGLSFLALILPYSYVFGGVQAISTGLTAIGSLANHDFKSIRIWPVVVVPGLIASVILAAIAKSERLPIGFVAICMAVHLCPAVACWALSQALLPVLARRAARLHQGDFVWRLRDVGWREWDPFWHRATGEDWRGLPKVHVYDEYLLPLAAALGRGGAADRAVEELSRIERSRSRWKERPDREDRARATVAAIQQLLAEFEGKLPASIRARHPGG